MLSLVLVILAQSPIDAALARYHEQTAAGPSCGVGRPDTTDITVCGMRHADRYRVPFAIQDAGDPAIQDVPAERAQLIAKKDNCAEKSLFLVGCGSVGVTYSTASGLGLEGDRPLAP